MNYPILQAHRGVSSDYPENTMTAFRGAWYQGYTVIELDPYFTSDDVLIVIHAGPVKRTGRNPDGSAIDVELDTREITYEQLCKYDFGIYVSHKYTGEKVPLLSEVLEFTGEKNILVKLDNRWEKFNDKQKDILFDTVIKSGAPAAFTVTSVESAKLVLKNIPNADIHYDGKYSEEVVKELSELVTREKLVVWLPFKTKATQWVKNDFATKEMCDTVNKYARLGLWILSKQEDYETAAEWGAYIVETNGKIKPDVRKGVLVDTHVHSRFSHDSKSALDHIKKNARKNGVTAVAVSDHCDIEYFRELDLDGTVKQARAAITDENILSPEPPLLYGIEIGEELWEKNVAKEIVSGNEFDQIIGSVHAVRYPGVMYPFSLKDFSQFSKYEAECYMALYFMDVKEMLKTANIDVLAHLTVPLRYINGKYKMGLDCKKYRNIILHILDLIIKKHIALEINTSCLDGEYDELMPEEWIIELYKELGGHLVTLGSDAHTSKNVGRGFERAVEMLKKYGFEYVCYFKDRYICQCTI